jgi:hypothetical protein
MNILKIITGINIIGSDPIKMKISKRNYNGVCLVIICFNLGASISYWFYIPHNEQLGLLFTFLLGVFALSIYILNYINKTIYNKHEMLLKRMILIGLFSWLFYETNVVGGFFYKSLEMIFVLYILVATSLLDTMYVSLGLIGGSLIIVYHIILYFLDIQIPVYIMKLLKINPLDYKAEIILFWLMFLSIGIVIRIFTGVNKKYNKIIEEQNAKNKHELDIAKEIVKYTNVDTPESFFDYYNLYVYQKPYYEISGDFYFIVEMKKKYYIFLVDVCGHGLEAAMFTVMLKKELHKLRDISIKNTAINFTKAVDEFLENVDKSTTITVVKIDPITGNIKYINNGNSLFIYGGQYGRMLQNSGFGLMQEYEVMKDNIKRKTLIMMTDGIIESVDENNKPFGINMVMAIIGHGENIMDNIVVNYNNYINKIQDDVTLLVIEDKR